MYGLGITETDIKQRVAFCDFLAAAQIFLQSNFLLERPLRPSDIKPRLLGHWGTCPGINFIYTNLKATFPQSHFILGVGHGFPALQANLWLDNALRAVDPLAKRNFNGLAHIVRKFSWPSGYPSHASPSTPGIINEGGELGYALGAAYGAALGRPQEKFFCLIGDGELETATALSSLNLNKILSGASNGKVIPILHLNGYRISGPTLYGRLSERELMQMFRGFGFQPVLIDGMDIATCQSQLAALPQDAFIIFKSPKGFGGPAWLHGEKIAGNNLSHQVPLPEAASDPQQLHMLETWLAFYHPKKLYEQLITQKGIDVWQAQGDNL